MPVLDDVLKQNLGAGIPAGLSTGIQQGNQLAAQASQNTEMLARVAEAKQRLEAEKVAKWAGFLENAFKLEYPSQRKAMLENYGASLYKRLFNEDISSSPSLQMLKSASPEQALDYQKIFSGMKNAVKTGNMTPELVDQLKKYWQTSDATEAIDLSLKKFEPLFKQERAETMSPNVKDYVKEADKNSFAAVSSEVKKTPEQLAILRQPTTTENYQQKMNTAAEVLSQDALIKASREEFKQEMETKKFEYDQTKDKSTLANKLSDDAKLIRDKYRPVVDIRAKLEDVMKMLPENGVADEFFMGAMDTLRSGMLSVLREGDRQGIKESSGWLAKAQVFFAGIKNGQKLSPETRQSIFKFAEISSKIAKMAMQNEMSPILEQAKTRGVPKKQILTPQEEAEKAPKLLNNLSDEQINQLSSAIKKYGEKEALSRLKQVTGMDLAPSELRKAKAKALKGK